LVKPKRVVKPFYNPPSLIARQALSTFYFGFLVRWKALPHWLSQGKKTLPTAAGAIGMGCIGFPIHPVWEITNACNLRCKQCHASSGKPLSDELTTEEGKRLLDDMAAISEFRMLALAGGEPLLRKDIVELVSYARWLGFEISIATNGTLLTPQMAQDFKKMGVANVAIGLNANDKKIHEKITQMPSSFERTKQAIHATTEAGLNLQINTTVMKENQEAIPDLLDFASEVNAQIVLLYQLVPEGRGEQEMELNIASYRKLLNMASQNQRSNKAIIEPICSPQYWAYLMSQNDRKPSRIRMRLAETIFKGCVAGSGLCYIKPNGDVWPCPFVPITAGNVRHTPLIEIWHNSEVFNKLRDRANLKGKCATCIYKNICGGCRGRAYAHYGDYLAEDPFCFLYTPAKD
jgi:radical SAM protein with 4Fe4S-binding SPASM domain